MPKPLFTKLIATLAVGFFCFIIGCPYSFIAKDPIFFFMSLFLFLCCLMKGGMLYHTIKKRHFISIPAKCIRIKKQLARRNIWTWFQLEDGGIIELSIDSRAIKVHLDRNYLLYFRTIEEPEGYDDLTKYFLCLNEIIIHSLPDRYRQPD